MRRRYILFLLAVMLLTLTPLLWCKDKDLNSIWSKSEITVDGKESEWSGSIYYLEDQKIGIGLQNDTANLYVLIKATDRARQMQLMRTGLTIWFDPAGKRLRPWESTIRLECRSMESLR